MFKIPTALIIVKGETWVEENSQTSRLFFQPKALMFRRTEATDKNSYGTHYYLGGDLSRSISSLREFANKPSLFFQPKALMFRSTETRDSKVSFQHWNETLFIRIFQKSDAEKKRA